MNGRNGNSFDQGQFIPYSAIVVSNELSLICMGALIGKQWIVTAAHCISQFPKGEENKNVILVAGVYKLKGFKKNLAYRSPEAHIHPDFNRKTFRNDIAVIRISRDAESIARPIPVISPDTKLPISSTGFINSYEPGKTRDRQPADLFVRYLNVYFRRTGRCAYFDSATNKSVFHKSENICAGVGQEDQAVCQIDSGSPLVYEYESGQFALAGLMSIAPPDCEHDGNPSIYTKVSHYIPFLQKYVTDLQIVTKAQAS